MRLAEYNRAFATKSPKLSCTGSCERLHLREAPVPDPSSIVGEEFEIVQPAMGTDSMGHAQQHAAKPCLSSLLICQGDACALFAHIAEDPIWHGAPSKALTPRSIKAQGIKGEHFRCHSRQPDQSAVRVILWLARLEKSFGVVTRRSKRKRMP